MVLTLFSGSAFGQLTPFGQLSRSSSNSSSSSSSSSSSDDVIRCVVDARWSNSNGSLIYSKQFQLPISLSMLTHVSKGTNCRNAEIRVTATFLTDSRNFICSGVVSNAMTAGSEAQAFNIEI